MAKRPSERDIKQYDHRDKQRANNPHVGLVNEKTDPDYGQVKKTYQYDPHLDPQLQWAGKTEHTSFEIPTVSLHVHERIDPKTIIESVRKEKSGAIQASLFDEEKKPLREAIEFYKHREGWSNRLIAGDSLLVMNSLLEKEGMAGKVQMVYFDPPYGIKYRSNFQPYTNKRSISDSDNENDLTLEPEMIKAFRDTWELGIHSFLTYLRDRVKLSRELLDERGSIFIQISDENLHLVRNILDEVFGPNNFMSVITFRTKIPLRNKYLAGISDYIIWYAKDIEKVQFNKLFVKREVGFGTQFNRIKLSDGTFRSMNKEELINPATIPDGAKIYRLTDLVSSGSTESCIFDFEIDGKVIKRPASGKSWKTTAEGIEELKANSRLELPSRGSSPSYRFFWEDYPVQELTNNWTDTQGATDKIYVVQTAELPIQRCMLMTTMPGELVFDPTCGSGTTAYVAETYGRRWITCDTSRISIALSKQRLITSSFEYFKLSHSNEGVSSGFLYESVPHLTLGQIANKSTSGTETLFDKPKIDNSKARITGPFTVESVPAPFAKSFDELAEEEAGADVSISRSGETLRQTEWRDELLRAGVRAKGGALIEFSRVEVLSGTKFIQAEAETKGENPEKVLVVFGPEHAPLEQRMVERALDEARYIKPDILLFCAFMFDEEAAKDIDETPENLVGFKLLKAQMNMDLQTDDLKKSKRSNESFWLIGQPDVRVTKLTKGEDKGKVQVEVKGFDYYNPKTGNVDSGGTENIAMWMLDTNYDGRSIFPSQVFFPMAGAKDGWAKLAKNLKAEIDEEKIEAFRGTVSIPFEAGDVIAVKIVDDRGIESLRVIKI